MIRLLLVHEVQLTCNILAAVLDEAPDITVVACATTAEGALAKVADCHVALVSTGLGRPNQSPAVPAESMALVRAMQETAPETKVLMLGLVESEDQVLPYVQAGASGYILPNDSVDDLLTRIRTARDDKALISPDIAAALITRLNELSQVAYAPLADAHRTPDLTPRELEILELIEQGHTNQEIADELVIQVGTVKNHVHNILRKLDVGSREDAAALASLMSDTAAHVICAGSE